MKTILNIALLYIRKGMNSSHLVNIGFINWFPFNEKTIKNAPTQSGVYVIRIQKGQCFGRLCGKSDIIYIGKTKAKKGIKERLSYYFSSRAKSSKRRFITEKRIYQLSKKYHLEISWYPTKKPLDLEMRLLKKYVHDHDELPPLNRAQVYWIYNGKDLYSKFVVS